MSTYFRLCSDPQAEQISAYLWETLRVGLDLALNHLERGGRASIHGACCLWPGRFEEPPVELLDTREKNQGLEV